ncbi:hypothetical protein N7527_010244 [Penicillium freii]|nr:hypothetical protein N7527_010244 [Penicillium freii]
MFSSSNDNKFQTPSTLPLYRQSPRNKKPLGQAQGPLRQHTKSDSAQVKAPATTKTRTLPIIQHSRIKKGRKGDLQLGHFPTLRNLPFLFHLITLRLHRSTILTVESNTSLKPAYFFTFVPDPSPILPPAHTAVIPPLKHTYTSDKNTLLSKITTHFLGQKISSLQVHYSTKLRHKASSRSRRPKKRQ